MRTQCVVVVFPLRDQRGCVFDACEPILIEALVSKSAIERLYKVVLEMMFNVRNLRPSDSVSLVKSIDHLSFGTNGVSFGVLLPQ